MVVQGLGLVMLTDWLFKFIRAAKATENRRMDFPISGTHINPLWLMGAGLIVGMLGGFFGVGGSFLAGPALFAFGVPMNFVVGTDMAHIVGKSIVAARNHWKLGNVDFKLGPFMVIGTIPGVETGAQGIQFLKLPWQMSSTRWSPSLSSSCWFVSRPLVAWESLTTLGMAQGPHSQKISFRRLHQGQQRRRLRLCRFRQTSAPHGNATHAHPA